MGQPKHRSRRGEDHFATVVIRGDLLDPDALAESAQRNFDVYGFYGVSVFAETAEVPWTDLAATRFIAVPWLVLFTAGDLESGRPRPVGHGRGATLRRRAR